MKFTRKNIIIISSIAIIVLIAAIKPGIPISIYKQFKKALEKEEQVIVKQIDSIEDTRIIKIKELEHKLDEKDIELYEVTQRLSRAYQQIRKDEKTIIDYRNGTFNEHFSDFTEFVVYTDSIQED